MSRVIQNSIHTATIKRNILTLENKSTKDKVLLHLAAADREKLLDVVFNRD